MSTICRQINFLQLHLDTHSTYQDNAIFLQNEMFLSQLQRDRTGEQFKKGKSVAWKKRQEKTKTGHTKYGT